MWKVLKLNYVAFPQSRSVPWLESWSLSWTNRGARISLYQILMSIVRDLEWHKEVDRQSGCIYTLQVRWQLKLWTSLMWSWKASGPQSYPVTTGHIGLRWTHQNVYACATSSHIGEPWLWWLYQVCIQSWTQSGQSCPNVSGRTWRKTRSCHQKLSVILSHSGA